MSKRASIAVLACALAGCQTKFVPTFPPLTRFHFPSGIAVDSPYTPDGGTRARYLYVVGDSNFDYAYDRGIVYAIDLDTLGDPTTGLIPPALANDAGWNGEPQRIPDVADAGDFDATFGYVYVDSLGGEMRLAQTSFGTNRLFLPSRFSNVVEAIDIVDGGFLFCHGSDGGRDCLKPESATPLQVGPSQGANQVLDVFGVSNPVVYTPPGGIPERDVFITHLRNQSRGSGGVVATGAYGNNTSQLGASFVIRESVDFPRNVIAEPIGQYTADGVAAQVLDGVLFAVVTGRFGGQSTAIRILSLGATPSPQPVFPSGQMAVNPGALLINIDLSAVLKGIDGRGITFSTNGDRVFALSRIPNAIVVLRNTFQYQGQLDLIPSWVASLPQGPTELVALPRVDASGKPIGDLVAISCADASSVVFYDDDLGEVVAQIPSLGLEPFAIAPGLRTLGRGPTAQVLPGVRLFVTAFATGQIVVIDVPDLMNPRGAQVIALIGTAEDTSLSPVNPNSNIFTPSSGYGTPGLQ